MMRIVCLALVGVNNPCPVPLVLSSSAQYCVVDKKELPAPIFFLLCREDVDRWPNMSIIALPPRNEDFYPEFQKVRKGKIPRKILTKMSPCTRADCFKYPRSSFRHK
jgi:hypothetical protein